MHHSNTEYGRRSSLAGEAGVRTRGTPSGGRGRPPDTALGATGAAFGGRGGSEWPPLRRAGTGGRPFGVRPALARFGRGSGRDWSAEFARGGGRAEVEGKGEAADCARCLFCICLCSNVVRNSFRRY